MSLNFQVLGDLVSISKGKKHLPHDSGKNRYINIENLHNPENSLFTNESGVYVEENDLIIAWDGANAGKVGIGFKGVIGSTLARLKLKSSSIFPRYLFWYLESKNSLIKSQRTGATIPHVNGNALKEIQIPLPPLATQKRIAKILDAADALRRKDQELLKKYDELTQAIFIDMFGDPVKNEKGWEVIKLGNTCGVGSSVRVFVEELVTFGVPFLRGQEIGAMSTGEKIEPSLFISTEHYDRLKAQGGIPKLGDLLMPSICPDGRIFQVVNEEPFYFKDGRVLWIKVNENHFDSSFLKFLLKEKFLRNYSNIASGTTFAELKIFALKDLELIMPPLSSQSKFSSLINSSLIQLERSRSAFKSSSSLFNAIIQKAFNGELVA